MLGDSTECIIYNSVVCCEGTMYPQKHTLRVYYMLLSGCFSVCFSLRLWKAVNDEQADASTRFFYVVTV